MGLLSWAGKVLRLSDGQFWSTYYGGENWAGRAVSEENALNLSAWWRAVRLYADVTGALPLKLYERLDNDDRVQVRDHELSGLIALEPNADQTPQEFWGGMAGSLAMLGNGFAEKMYSGKRLVALDPLPCDTVPSRKRNPDGDLEYRYLDRGKEVVLPRDKVFHIRGFVLGKSDLGMSPLAAGRQGLSIALATEEATGKQFSQGLRVSGFFTGKDLTVSQREQFTKSYIDPITGNDAKNHYGILPPGFDFKPLVINPKDAEMLLSRKFNVEEICRFMGMPPIMVGHHAEGQTAWGTGVESIINMWLTLGYNSFLRYIESSINRWLLSASDRRRFYVEYERNALLRIDSQARAEFISKMIQNAQMTPNEGRKTDNRLPMDGGDQLLINSTLVPLTQAGQKPARVQPAPGEPIPEPTP
jgi:HK97 family phage portal protein